VRQALAARGPPCPSTVDTFEAWDTDGDGWLCEAELEAGIRRTLGLELRTEDVQELLRHADTNGDGLLSYREFAAEFGARGGASQLSRAERMLRHRRQRAGVASASAGSGVPGLQGVVMGLDRTESVGREMSKTLTAIGEPSGQFDWRQLAALGTYFVCSGGHASFHGDGRVTTLPGYRPSIAPRAVALTHGCWYCE
jgi:hypothetical protein